MKHSKMIVSFFCLFSLLVPRAHAITEPDEGEERGSLTAPAEKSFLWDRNEAEDLPKTPLQVEGAAPSSGTPSPAPSEQPSSSPSPAPSPLDPQQ